MTSPNSLSPEQAFLDNRALLLQMTAANLDVTDEEARARSCADLVELFFSLVTLAAVDIFVEAGAKEAAASRRAAGSVGVGTVVAYEANPYTYRKYRAVNDAADGVDYRHRALTDEAGPVTFNVLRREDGTPRADGRASLLKRQTDLERGFVEVEVPGVRLDDEFADVPGSAALWVDVEGATRPVLHGGTSLLTRTAVALVEVEDRRFWGEDQWLSGDVSRFLLGHGLVPVARDFQSRFQFNYLYASTDLLAVDRVSWLLTRHYSHCGARPVRRPDTPPAPPTSAPGGAVARLVRRLLTR